MLVRACGRESRRVAPVPFLMPWGDKGKGNLPLATTGRRARLRGMRVVFFFKISEISNESYTH